MGRSGHSNYGKGYKDGVEHAKHERDANVGDLISDAINDPRYDHKGSDDYKEGFREGRQSEQGKKR